MTERGKASAKLNRARNEAFGKMRELMRIHRIAPFGDLLYALENAAKKLGRESERWSASRKARP